MTNNPFPVQNPVPGWINFLGSVSFKREARPCRRQYSAGGINEGTSCQPAARYPPSTLPKALLSLSFCGAHSWPQAPRDPRICKPPIQGVHMGLAFTAQANTPRPSRWEVHKLSKYKTTGTRLPQGEFARVRKWECRRAQRQCQRLIVELMQGEISTTW